MSKDRFDIWVQIATRYFFFANAGGSIAVLSFLGTRSEPDTYSYFAIVALACFVTGVIVAGITIMGQLTGAYREFLTSVIPDPIAVDRSIKNHLATRIFDMAEPRTGRLLCLAFGLFILGSVVGLVGLIAAVSSPTTEKEASAMLTPSFPCAFAFAR